MGAVLGTRRQPAAPARHRESDGGLEHQDAGGRAKGVRHLPVPETKMRHAPQDPRIPRVLHRPLGGEVLLRAEPQQWIREDEEGPPPSGRSLTLVGSYMVDIKLAGAPHSTAAALETLLSSSRLVGAVCTTMHSDYVVLRDAPKSINRAKPGRGSSTSISAPTTS